MASLTIGFTPATIFSAITAKGGNKQEKGFLDFILGGMTKEDGFFETDPILKKGEEKNGGTTSRKSGTTGGKNGTVIVPAKKKAGGFGGFFPR
ncbi:hypothetical protein ACHQM5_009456 [Ranunculus cassubicifolius]